MDLIEKYLADDKSKKLYNQEVIILEVTEAICSYMNENSISRTELAEKLGKDKSFVSQVLNGPRNFTLRTLADICFALECKFHAKLDTFVTNNHSTGESDARRVNDTPRNFVRHKDSFPDFIATPRKNTSMETTFRFNNAKEEDADDFENYQLAVNG